MSSNKLIRINIKQLISICTLVMLAITIVIVISILTESSAASLVSPTALNEIIPDSVNENVDNSLPDNVNNINTLSISDKATELKLSNTEDISDEAIALSDNPTEITEVDPYQLITSDIESIKNKDSNTIQRYFGTSSAFTTDIVADKLAATKITFISSEVLEDNSTKVIVHICTLDYNKMLESKKTIKEEKLAEGEVEDKINEHITKELAKGVVNRDFDVHYNIPLIVKDNSVVITEEFKQAITGGWYTGLNAEIQEITCPIETDTTETK